jgi:hypothetical protein
LMATRISVNTTARMKRKPSMPASRMVVIVSSRYSVTQRCNVRIVLARHVYSRPTQTRYRAHRADWSLVTRISRTSTHRLQSGSVGMNNDI